MQELVDAVQLAIDRPHDALARVWSLVASDHALVQACLGCRNADPAAYDQHSDDLYTALWEKERTPGGTTRVHALAALRALDQLLVHSYSPSQDIAIGAALVSGEQAWIHRRPPGWRSRFTRQPNHLQYWMRYHWIVPAHHQGILVHLAACSADLTRQLGQVIDRGSLRVFVGGFVDGVEPDWMDSPPRYACTMLTDTEQRWQSVLAALERARAIDAHVVVLPELTVCMTLRQRVEDWLAAGDHPLRLVVPGSFHRVHAGERANRAVVLDRFGNVVLSHRKLAPMLIGPGRFDTDVIEDIEGGSLVSLLATPLGLLGVAICLDFCEMDGSVGTLWQQVGPGMVLVPSMSDAGTVRAHKDKAKKLAIAHDTITAVAVQPHEHKAGVSYGVVMHERNRDNPDEATTPDGILCFSCSSVQVGASRSARSG